MKYSLRSLMRFSIRDLFWITVVAALVLGWLIDHRRTATERDDARNDAKLLVGHTQDPFLKMHRTRVEEIAKKYDDVAPTYSAPAPNSPKK